MTAISPADSPTVSITSLCHTYGKGSLQKQVIFDVNLSLHPGEVVILEGPSGSGKTTLLTLIGALRSVQQGSVSILGRELNGATKRQLIGIRNQIGFIFQSHNLLDCLMAWENVSTALKLHTHIPRKEYRHRAVQILAAVGLGEHVDYYPKNLSGGQKQRVAIARALVSEPRLVLADEPTSALDSKTGRTVVDTMQRLAREEGCAVLLVTHDNRILDIADRIIHMEDGRIVAA
ncbi:MAG: DevA family ABC transporter ATP-binding protein [Cyanobacteria bacterium P01_A01_bin.135]